MHLVHTTPSDGAAVSTPVLETNIAFAMCVPHSGSTQLVLYAERCLGAVKPLTDLPHSGGTTAEIPHRLGCTVNCPLILILKNEVYSLSYKVHAFFVKTKVSSTVSLCCKINPSNENPQTHYLSQNCHSLFNLEILI